MKDHIKINQSDNVAVVLADTLPKGAQIEGITLLDDVKRGHKVALNALQPGEPVIKYGFPIGHATRPVRAGEWVHSHNMATSLGKDPQYEYHPAGPPPSAAEGCYDKNFMGYRRTGGKTGIRNELWIIPTVGCVNAQAKLIAERLKAHGPYEGVDDICAFTHNYGCSQLGTDHANTRAALAAVATHPNAGGVLVLGLGCENNQIDALRSRMGDFDPSRVRFLVAQDVDDEIETGLEICRDLIDRMSRDKREMCPASDLKIGVKCGGSDGLSGITANPLVGKLTDRLTACGGTVVLTEVPEMFGAETILMDRAKNRDVFLHIVDLINNFKNYFRSYGQPIYENPSPGNKAGGITTLEEKSLGCVQKGGSSIVTDVLTYAQQATEPGLNLLDAPGNDLVAATALALSGCQMVLFTTGRGTPFGTMVPTMKIATNTPLAHRKQNWVDFNAGVLLEDTPTDTTLDALWKQMIDVANGSRLRNETAGAKEIAIFKTGVTL